MSRTARDLTRTSAFDALYYDVRARFIVVASRRVARAAAAAAARDTPRR
jgi:hypothetical protein